MINIKKILLLFVALASTGVAQAQHVAGEWSFIPKVGVDLSKFNDDVIFIDISGEKKVSSTYKEGLAAGFDVEYFLHDHASMSAGLYYMNMGSRFKDFMSEDQNSGEGISNNRMTMDFVQVPVMAGLHLDNGLSVKLGVQMGRMVHSKTRMDIQTWTRDDEGVRTYGPTQKQESDYLDEWKQKFYFGIPVALSYEYQNVIIEARYVRSLTHPLKADAYEDSHHSTFVFTVGYRIR